MRILTEKGNIMNIYKIGQIFEGIYPPEAAIWCNANRAFIVELEPQDGKHIFQIQEIPAPTQDVINQERITKLKQMLADTDYVAAKLAEVDGEERAALLAEYAEVLAQRKAWRNEINNLTF